MWACRFLALTAAVSCAACATRPPPVPEDAGVDVPAAWSQVVAEGALPLAGWWRAFGDAELVRLVEAALEGFGAA